MALQTGIVAQRAEPWPATPASHMAAGPLPLQLPAGAAANTTRDGPRA